MYYHFVAVAEGWMTVSVQDDESMTRFSSYYVVASLTHSTFDLLSFIVATTHVACGILDDTAGRSLLF